MKYWINMKTSQKRTAQSFKASQGFDPEGFLYNAMRGSNCTKLNIGWLVLHFGRDGNWNEFVVAEIDVDIFHLSVDPLPVPVDPCFESGIKWVYVMKHHPEELFVGRKPPTVLQYAGITVVHAMDQRRRNFVTVEMPGGKLHLVFRNPASRATQDWRPVKKAITINPVQVVTPAVVPTPLRVDNTMGDAEFDQLLRLFA
jgi:hypothetical protein